MKRILTLFVFLSVLFGCTGGKTVFEGKIIGYNGEFTEFFLLNPEGGYVEVPFEINEDGTFSAELDFARSEFDARLFVDKFMFCTCVEKGKKYYAEFDITVPEVETNFRFIGEGEKENAFTRDFWNTFGFAYMFMESVDDVSDFKSYQDRIRSVSDTFRERVAETGNKGFSDFYTAEIDNRYNTYSALYPYFHIALNGELPSDQDYEAFLATDPFGAYTVEQIQGLLGPMASNIAYMDGIDFHKALQAASRMTSVKSWNDFLMTSILMNRLQGAGADGLAEAYAYYREVVTDENYYAQVAKIYEDGSRLLKGAVAPDIEIADPSGKKIKLSDLKGKALYIDFWASWCRPCCQEIPFMAKLVEELGNDPDIECISISIDEDLDSWKARMAQDNPSWPQYVATPSGQETIAGDYHITGIPRFILLDRQGCIITVNAPRPSGLSASELKAMLK